VQVTETSFRALARSSPWRWRCLHFRHRGGPGGPVEAWLDRPDRLRVRTADGAEHLVTEELGAGIGWGSAGLDVVEPRLEWIYDVEPDYDLDGLVARRPRKWGHVDNDVQFDDPMWQTYHWVAMLDPDELAEGTAVEDVRPDEVLGRPVWRARVRPLADYEPRCGCCPLLFSEISTRSEYDDWDARFAGTVFPEAHDVALDVETGVVVRVDPVGGDATTPTGGAIDILDVGPARR
jgi:hypothetical protein